MPPAGGKAEKTRERFRNAPKVERKALWSSPADVKARYAAASIVSAEPIVFNIKGNDYRLVVAVDYQKSILWIKWIGTHKEYDKIDVKEVKYNG